MSSREPTPLGAIQPPAGGALAGLIAAARRWRDLAGPALAHRLPLLDVRHGTWIIGIPSPLWQDELDRLARKAAADGQPLPALVGRLVPVIPSTTPPRCVSETDAPAPGAGAAQRLRWLRDRLTPPGEGS